MSRRETATKALIQQRAALATTTYVGVRSIETLKATSSESAFLSRWAGQQAQIVDTENRLAGPNAAMVGVPVFLGSLSLVAIIVVGGLQVIRGVLTIGSLVAFQSLLASFSSPVRQVVGIGGRAQSLGAQLQRLDDVLDHPVDPAAWHSSDTRQPDRPRLAGRIELIDVTFGYSPRDPPLIRDLSLVVEPGSRIALVGASGAGKTTVLRLVGGLLQPWSGQVLIDGRDRVAVDRSLLASSVAAVDQDVTLFTGTVRQNISLWDDTVSLEEVVQAATDACIHEQIVARRGGYEARVDEAGRNFSGGERQRLGLARALARDPAVLVLDEASSALDPVTEQEVDRAIRRRGCSVLVVAHRLSTIRDSDEILVLDDGDVVERGTHADLFARGGAYTRLVGAEGDVGD